MKKAILFDLWNTLANKNQSSSKILKEQFQINCDNYLEEYEKAIQTKKWNNPYEMAESYLNYFNISNTDENREFFVKTLLEGIKNAQPYEGTKKLLKELKKEYKIGLLSNTNNYEVLKEEWDMNNLFDTIIYSWQTGTLKPEKKSFDMACQDLEVKTEECMFIDDMEKNVKFANKYGLKGIRYIDIETLKKDIKKE